jgi:hypothetical protein
MRITPPLFVILFCLCILSCRKSENYNPNDNNNFTVTNTWNCDIDGVHYSGTVDTSIMHRYPYPQTTMADTLLICTGTSNDKKANIHFYLWINRKAWGHDSILTHVGANSVIFDTTGLDYYVSRHNRGDVIFKITNFSGTKIRGTFYGSIAPNNGGMEREVTNGEISFDIGHGNNEPKFFSYTAKNVPVSGYIKRARHISNTLIMDGISFTGDSTFELMVRTGGQLRPGIYESIKGDVGLEGWRPSIVTHYVSDTAGNLTVNIQSVNNGIIEGTFSGMAQGDAGPTTTASIVDGKFKCRVLNYTPQQDSANKWGFVESNGLQYPYNIYGGNILSAKRSQEGPVYFITVLGESDHGLSAFKIKLRAWAPLTTGMYEYVGLGSTMDSIYFKRNAYPSFELQVYNGPVYCMVDSLDNEKIVGRFYGRPHNGANAMRKGFFRARF